MLKRRLERRSCPANEPWVESIKESEGEKENELFARLNEVLEVLQMNALNFHRRVRPELEGENDEAVACGVRDRAGPTRGIESAEGKERVGASSEDLLWSIEVDSEGTEDHLLRGECHEAHLGVQQSSQDLVAEGSLHVCEESGMDQHSPTTREGERAEGCLHTLGVAPGVPKRFEADGEGARELPRSLQTRKCREIVREDEDALKT